MNKREVEFDAAAWEAQERRRKKRASRWGRDEKEKTFIPGMPTVIPMGLSKEQEEQYLLQLQIEEISRRLRTGDLGIPPNPEERSSSPEPIYNSEGKRLNTREYRTRKKLEEERHQQIQRLMKCNTDYKPPADYKPPIIRVSDKVMIPQEEHPDINFVGLLIGPRGNTLKNLEKETGAKIIIRGKGSVKEGKIGRKDGQPLPGEDEPLHAYVTANNPENVKKAVEKIKDIIKQGIEVPEGQNDLRRQQLRELALLNGTLRENDGLVKLKQLQQAQTIITNTIVCTVCGGTGHIAADCKQKRPGDTFRAMQNQSAADKAKMDSEYMSLMAELGEGPPPPKQNEHHRPHHSNRSHFSGPLPRLTAPPPHHPPPQLTAPPSMQNRPPFDNHHQHMNEPPHLPQPPSITNRSPFRGGPPSQMNGPPPPHQSPHMNRPPMRHQPPQLGQPPWQSQQQNQPPHMQNKPPGMMNHGSQPPHSQPPPVSVSMGGVSQPPPMGVGPGSGIPTSAGVPPPGVLPPPPPPPNTQLPWQQQQQQSMGAPPPPPPSVSGSAAPPWQQMTSSVGPVPPPPCPPGGLPPWQQQAPPPPGHHSHSNVPGPVAPPPPPPGSQHSHGGFNPTAPPPPPPGSMEEQRGMGMRMPGIPLGVPPPPPPN